MARRILSLFLALSLLFIYPFAVAEQGEVSALFINVGKADAMLLRVGEKTYLVDTGTDLRAAALMHALRAEGVMALDAVFITHSHSDHVGGLPALLSESGVTVKSIYAPQIAGVKKLSKHPAAQAAREHEIPMTWLRAGDVIPLGEDATLRVLAPLTLDTEEENNNSLVAYIETKHGTLLLTGDMEFPEENTLLPSGLIPCADVLKIAHHGKDDATSAELLAAAQPRIAVISTSMADDYTTPSDKVLERIKAVGAETYVTKDATVGIRVTLRSGNIDVSYVNYPGSKEQEYALAFTNLDFDADTVTLINTGDTEQSLDGWTLYSERGDQVFRIPEGTTLPAGGAIVIGGESSEASLDLVWPVKRIWNVKNTDTVELYNDYGRRVLRAEKTSAPVGD